MQSEENLTALGPTYSTKDPKQPIQLYEGLMEITQKDKVFSGRGTVFFDFCPFSDIKFRFLPSSSFERTGSEVYLKLPCLTEKPLKSR